MFRSLIALVLVSTLSAGPVSIGLISASGPLTVDRSSIWGNATVFEGTSVSTATASGDVALRNGVRIQLGAQSQAVIGETRAKLEKGSSRINASTAYEVEARGLKIDAGAGSRLLVALNSADRVEVTAISGKASVRDQGGLLLAAIPQGKAVAFAMPQTPGPTSVMRSGCLLYKDMRFILHDDATNEVIELNGPDLALNVGKSVQITGAPTAVKPVVSIATAVMNVTSVAPRSTGGCLVIAQSLDAQTQVPAAGAAPTAGTPTAPTPTAAPAGTGAGQSTGMSSGTKTAIIIIAVAGVGGGVGAALALKGSTSK